MQVGLWDQASVYGFGLWDLAVYLRPKMCARLENVESSRRRRKLSNGVSFNGRPRYGPNLIYSLARGLLKRDASIFRGSRTGSGTLLNPGFYFTGAVCMVKGLGFRPSWPSQ